MHPLGLLALFLGDRKPVADVNALDHQNTIVGFDLPDRLDVVAVGIDFDLTRLQRAGERARQSAAGSCHDVIERGRMGRVVLGSDAVMLGDL
jgi:hypothetical protein